MRWFNVIAGAIISALVLMVCCSSTGGAYELTDMEDWLRHAESILSRTDSYTAVFHKQELIQADLTDEETIFLKFKKPFKIYMKWIKGPYKGRESLYVEGCNKNRVKVRECGLAGMMAVDLDPGGSLIMKGSRHPVTDSGLENLVKLIRENLRKGTKAGDADFRVHGEEIVYEQRTQKVEITFPRNRAKGYYCYRAILNLDTGRHLPVRAQIFNWDNALVESYGYEAIKLDAGLSEADFDRNNPEYRF